MRARLSGGIVDGWAKLGGLVPTKTFSVHIMHSFAYMYKDATSFERSWHIPLLELFG